MSHQSKQIDPQELASQLELTRLQQVKAKTNLERTKERARLAKRRRKEAKEAFRRARKEIKRAKKDLAKVEDMFSELEAKLAEAVKVQAMKRPKVKKQMKTKASHAKTSPLASKAASPLKKTGMKQKGRPHPIISTAEIAPATAL